jgi:hypothetical protein
MNEDNATAPDTNNETVEGATTPESTTTEAVETAQVESTSVPHKKQ